MRSFWLGAVIALAVWFVLNAITAAAKTGQTVTFTTRMAHGYALASLVLFAIANLLHMGLIP